MTALCSILKHAFATIAGFNDSVALFEWLGSLRSRLNGRENQQLKEDDVLKLKTSVQCLRYTVRVMEDLINRAEWKSHEKLVAELLPELKAAFYDAEDLLEGFRYYELKVQIEGSATSSELGTTSFHYDIQGDHEKFNCAKKTLDDLTSKLQALGLLQATLHFDKSVRPKTALLPIEAKIFGRHDEIKKLIGLLVPSRSKRKRNAIGSSASNQVSATLDNNEASIPVLPIVGIGGVGKTTLAQAITKHQQVKRHFDEIVWICVSDDFDVIRLTKEAIGHFSRRAPTTENLSSLQYDLASRLSNRRSLIVLDDVWSEDVDLWKRFCAPFNQVLEGSMMLVTTRSPRVADIVRTMDCFPLNCLDDGALKSFLEQCVFRPDGSNHSDELKSIVEQILPKLKGSPLAAKTLGRLLRMTDDPAEWNNILDSQLWELPQKGTDILPALRLSYMYLPFHLKRCFSFCAVYPKDYNFVKEDLAQIWVAEGFVEPQRNIPLQQTACKYFEELAYLSFFQEFRGKYVIHDLIHDMAQLVSKDECFIIKEKNDLEMIPKNIRHLSVLKSKDFKCSVLESLCKQTKLRTLFCNMSLKGKIGNNVMEKWCAELVCMRVMVCASISKSGLPDNISNMKNLRYIKISEACLFDSLPATLRHLYNLQLLSARKCRIKAIPKGFNNLINLQKVEMGALKIDAFKLILDWSKEINLSPRPQVHNEIEAFQALCPPSNIRFVRLKCYPGEYLPSWFHGSDNPIIFSSLIEIIIEDCLSLSSLEQFLQPGYMPAIKKMELRECKSLESVPVERFGGLLPSLEELEVYKCPKIKSQRLLAPSLKKLSLADSGNLGDDIDCSSLTTFSLSFYDLASLTLNREKVPLLNDLTIKSCRELETLNGGWPILEKLSIWNCPHLKWQNGTVLPLPSSLQTLCLWNCGYFSVSCLENLTSLESLAMINCEHIKYIQSNLWSENLIALQNLDIHFCEHLESIGGPKAIEHIPKVFIKHCPKLEEIQQPLQRGYITYV